MRKTAKKTNFNSETESQEVCGQKNMLDEIYRTQDFITLKCSENCDIHMKKKTFQRHLGTQMRQLLCRHQVHI